MEFFRRHRIDIIIFFIAVLLRVFLFSVNYHAAENDIIATIRGDDGYFELSRNLLNGDGFSWDNAPPYVPNPMRTPVYPGLIAAILFVFGSYWAVLLTQILIGSSLPVLGRHLSLRLSGSHKISLWVAVMLAFEPYLILFSSIFYTETLFIFFFLIFALLFLSSMEEGNLRRLFIAGIVIGIATLTKPTVQYLPVALAPFVWWYLRGRLPSKQLFTGIGIFLLTYLIVLSPWLIRNHRMYGEWGLTSQAPTNLVIALVPSVLSIENGTSFVEEQAAFATQAEIGGNFITLKNADFYTKKALNVLKEHPKGLLISSGITLVTFFTHDGMLTVLGHMGYVAQIHLSKPALSMLMTAPLELARNILDVSTSPLILIFIMRLFFILVTGFFIFGLCLRMKEEGFSAKIVFVLLVIAYFVLTSMVGGFAANARYRMPVDVLIFTFAAIGFADAYLRTINKLKTAQ